MFEFAFAVGVALIIPLLVTHYYFKDKIKKNSESKKDEYCKAMAKTQVDSVRSLIERPQPVQPLSSIQPIPQTIPHQIIEISPLYFNFYFQTLSFELIEDNELGNLLY